MFGWCMMVVRTEGLISLIWVVELRWPSILLSLRKLRLRVE